MRTVREKDVQENVCVKAAVSLKYSCLCVSHFNNNACQGDMQLVLEVNVQTGNSMDARAHS